MTRNDQQWNFDGAVGSASRPLYFVVGARRLSPCAQEVFTRFKLWVVETLTQGAVDCYAAGCVSIAHWDERAGHAYPHLLNPCECSMFLPLEVETGPLLGSVMGLLSDLQRLKHSAPAIPAEFAPLIGALMDMAEQ